MMKSCELQEIPQCQCYHIIDSRLTLAKEGCAESSSRRLIRYFLVTADLTYSKQESIQDNWRTGFASDIRSAIGTSALRARMN